MSLALVPRARPDKFLHADDGRYFVSTNPTPGTGINFAVNAAVSETAGYFLTVQNTATAVGGAAAKSGSRVYLDYLRLICVAVPASATAGELFVKVDSAGRTSGGTQCPPVNPNFDSAAASVSDVWAGAITTAARASARLVARAKLRAAIPVAGDEWNFVFGSQEHSTAQVLNGTNSQRMPIGLAPVVLAPQSFALLQLWFPGNAATPASFEFELGLIEA